MSALLLHLRTEARRRWPAWLAVVVLVGVVGGLVLGALAGARRTSTAYDRMAEATEPWDLLVNPNEGVGSALDPDAVASLDQVEDFGIVEGVTAVLLDADGMPRQFGAELVLAAEDPEILIEFSRPRVADGELYDPADPGELMMSETVAASLGVGAGDVVQVGTLDFEELFAWETSGAEGPPPVVAHDVRVAGIVVTHDTIVEDDAFDYGTVYLTPAFSEAHDLEAFFYGMALRLRGGSRDVSAVRSTIQDLAPGEAIEFKSGAAVEDTVERGTLPHVIAVLAFAAVLGLAGTVVSGQLVARQLADLRGDAPALRALGVDRRQLRRAAAVRATTLAGAGGLLALLVAVAVSPLFPVGVAERAEIDPGVSFDAVVLVPGALLLVSVLLGWSAVTARRLTADRTSRPQRVGLIDRIAAAAPGPVTTMGLRASIAGGGGGRDASARGAIGGLAVAVAAVAATVTFGSSLEHLVSTPEAYGWNWQAMMTLPSDDWDVPPSHFIDRAVADERLEQLSVLHLDQVEIDGARVPAVGIDYQRGDVGPTVVSGRRPERSGEVALGGRTMRMLGVGIGDDVAAGEEGRRLEVVGQAVFAGLGTYPGADRTELGKGALFHREELLELGEGFDFESITAASADREDLADGIASVLDGQQAAIDEDEIQVLDVVQRPADIKTMDRVRSTPMVVAGLLAALGGTAFAFVLVTGVRRRRREIALLKTFGFGRREVAGTIVWQATVTALLALVVGIPLGIVSGRLGWAVLARALGVADDAHFDAGLVVLVVAVIVVANLVAIVPGRVAAGTRAAAMLRSE